jgi:hypothetical protein
MEIELTEIFGRKMDMRTAQDLSRYFRDEVLNSSKVQYAEGWFDRYQTNPVKTYRKSPGQISLVWETDLFMPIREQKKQ